jgi:DNA-binding MarR family transcriptional regulator
MDRLEKLFRQLGKAAAHQWQQGGSMITQSHHRILRKLLEGGPQKASQLAEALYMTSGAITGISDKIVEEGLADRYRDEKDRRVVYLSITDKGRLAAEQANNRKAEIFRSFFEGLTDADIDRLIQIFEQIANNAENRIKENK